MDDAAPETGVVGVGMSMDHSADCLGELGPALDRFERLGVDSVELFLPALGVVLGGAVQARRLATLRALCADRPYGFTLHGPLSADLGDRENAALQRDVCRAGLEVAGALGATVYVQHQTIAPNPEAHGPRLACEREALALLGPEAEAAGCALAVETMFCHPGERTALPHELAEQIAKVGHPSVGAVLDFSHGLLNAAARGADFLASMAPLAPHARHLHIHDSFGRPPRFRPWSRGDAMSFGFGDLHLPPGDGAVPWAGLSALSFGGPAIANLELDQRWKSEWPAAIAWTRAWIAEIAAARAPARRRASR